ncbi:MAG: MBL fold metallo-hydrolase [Archangium sp.]|nr:MBL fold metallo-hydrolase [Archangium sp.]
MEFRFWGVRGSIASSSAAIARIGGNTSCVEVTSQGHRLILDAGTGVRGLGEALLREPPVNTTMLFSHLHWDHVQGFPFFAPAYRPDTSLALYGPGMGGAQQLASVLATQMEPPAFPVPLSAMRAAMTFADAVPGHVFEVGPFRITPMELPHPQGCVGYHVEADGQRLAYCTDVELTATSMASPLARVLEGVDALVLDAQYTRDEYEGRSGPPRRGWGHSTNLDAADIAEAVSAQRLFLFHHDPGHSDEAVEAMAEVAKRRFARAEPAREGVVLQLG